MKFNKTQIKSIHENSYGFTLLELLLAVSIMTIIVTALYGIFNYTQRALRLNLNQSDVLEAARITLETLRQDLVQMVAPPTNDISFYAMLEVSPMQAGDVRLTNWTYTLAFLKKEGAEYEASVYKVIADGYVGSLFRYSQRLQPLNYKAKYIEGLLKLDPSLFGMIIDGVVLFNVEAFDFYGMSIIQPSKPRNYPDTVQIIAGSASTGKRGLILYDRSLPVGVIIELGVLEPNELQTYRNLLYGKGANPTMLLNPALAQKFLAQRAGQIHIFKRHLIIPRGNLMPIAEP